MSELQISLMAIGILVVLAVYLYGAWQQRRYRNRFGAAFKSGREDALYQGTLSASAGQGAANIQFGDVADGYSEETEPDLFPGLFDASEAEDDQCTTIGPETDYIAVMFASSPLHTDVLTAVWSRRFDFGPPIHVCGVRASNDAWERVPPESPHGYDTLRIALQLADRNGPVSRVRVEDFREMLRDVADVMHTELNLPEVNEALEHARRLDAICAEVDQMVGLNILPAGDGLLMGGEVARVAGRHGLVLQADGAFHLLDADGRTLFTLRNFDESPFMPHELDDTPVIGLSLQLDVPRVAQPARRFEEMVVLARILGDDLRADVVDDHRVALGDAGIAMIRKQVASIDKKMQAYAITPGSPLARRLFA
jgi:FtsZ-interacting cell division protein ZipA